MGYSRKNSNSGGGGGGGVRPGFSKHSNLEMKAECLMKTMSYLNSNISRTKNGRNARIKKSYRIY